MHTTFRMVAVLLAAALVVWLGARFVMPIMASGVPVRVPVPSAHGTAVLHLRLPRGWSAHGQDARVIQSRLRRVAYAYAGSVDPPASHAPGLRVMLVCVPNPRNLTLEDCARTTVATRSISRTREAYKPLPPIGGSRRMLRIRDWRSSAGDPSHEEIVYVQKPGNSYVYALWYSPVIEAPGDRAVVRRILRTVYVE